jgi:hypothetical protein
MTQSSTWRSAGIEQDAVDAGAAAFEVDTLQKEVVGRRPWKTIPFVPAASTPAVPASQEMVIDLVMVTAPKPPGSRQLISPAAAVLEIAPAKVLHGAVRLHGLASSPTPETRVLVARA